MALVVHNTLGGTKEPFVTREPGKVAMYVCGINPYDYCHIGHARAYVTFDVIRRYLEHLGYQATVVQNFTDIEDNIIDRANQLGIDFRELTAKFTDAYFEDMDALRILRAHHYPKATEHIPQMIRVIEGLIEKGIAYPANGDVLYAVRKLPAYGALSGRTPDAMLAGARVEKDVKKHDPLDFVLWKAAKPGEPSWESPWGPGRPGWHIECSAMALEYLGNHFDIHGGGEDLVFPHHENEIAQSDGYTGEPPFARYWLHNALLNLRREKMSKSVGNIETIRSVIGRVGPDVLRLYLLSAHYRTQIEYGPESLDEAKAALDRLRVARETALRLAARPEQPGGASTASAALAQAAETAASAFHAAMEDDFNTPQALAALYSLARELHQHPSSADKAALSRVAQVLTESAGLLGIELEAAATRDGQVTADLVELLMRIRTMAREAKQFAIADTIRQQLADLGIVLEDHAEGTSWRWK